MITTTALSPAVDKIYFTENFEAGRLYRVKNTERSAGGKGINVARVAAFLGEKVYTLGFKAGGTGEWLQARISDLGVRTGFIEVEGESRTNNNIIDEVRQTETEVLETGPFISEEKAAEFMKLYRNALAETDVLVCSGGLPEGIPVDFYKKMIEIACSYDVKVILDTNGETLKAGIKAKPYMVKPNLRELGQLAGKKLSSRDEMIRTCKSILEQGVKMVVASMGGEGALLVSEKKILYARVPGVEVVNTIGSGDSMVAGLASGLTNGYTPEDMLRLGTACAVANTQFRKIGFVTRETVDRFKEEIVIEDISWG